MSDTQRVTLAYPYTDAEGVTHQPDETIEVPLLDARNLLSDGFARVPVEGEEQPVEPTPEPITVVLAYPYDGHEPDEAVTLPAEVADGLISDGLARLPEAEAPAEGGQGEGDEKPGYDAPIVDIVAYVGDDRARAQEYLDAENAKPSPRSTLIEQLDAIVADPDA